MQKDSVVRSTNLLLLLYFQTLCTYLCMCSHAFPSVFPSSLSSWSQVTARNLSFSVVAESPTSWFSHDEEKIEWLQLLYRWESPNIDSSLLVPESFFLHCLRYLGWKGRSGWVGGGNQNGMDSSMNWTCRCCFVILKAEVQITALVGPSRALSVAFLQTS